MLHGGMPYDPIHGQGQGHECLKATQEQSTSIPHWTNFFTYLTQIMKQQAEFKFLLIVARGKFLEREFCFIVSES